MMGPGPAAPPGEDPSKARELFNVRNHMNNVQVVYFSRVYSAIVGGIFTGVLGVTGVQGLLHMAAWQLLYTVLLLLKSGSASSEKRFFRKTQEIMFDQAFTGTTLLTFILFWTFAYSIVYVF